MPGPAPSSTGLSSQTSLPADQVACVVGVAIYYLYQRKVWYGPEALAECCLVVDFLFWPRHSCSCTIPIRTARVTTCTRRTPLLFRLPTAYGKERKKKKRDDVSNRIKNTPKKERKLQLRITSTSLQHRELGIAEAEAVKKTKRKHDWRHEGARWAGSVE